MIGILQQLKVMSAATVANCMGNDPSVCETGLPHTGDTNGALQIILNWTFGLVAGIAVLVIAFAALRLVIAARDGDPQAISRMRSTILYAAIGLIVALLADSIVYFVLGRV
jgi:uncharacterized protein YacL